MTRIVLVRHGETEGNKEKIYRGRWDLSLNAHGEKQVKATGLALKEESFDAIYTSPLKRAMQTAKAIAAHQQVEVVGEEALIDIDYGLWEKRADQEVKEEMPGLYECWKNTPHEVVFPNGEALSDVQNRLLPLIERMEKQHREETIAWVSHRVPIKVMLCWVLGLGLDAFWRIQVDTASFSLVEIGKEKRVLLCSNECCHLKDLVREEKKGECDF